MDYQLQSEQKDIAEAQLEVLKRIEIATLETRQNTKFIVWAIWGLVVFFILRGFV